MKHAQLRPSILAVVAVLAVVFAGAAFLIMDHETSDAATGTDLSSTYGTPTTITIAPGYKYTYNVTVPTDLMAGTTVSAQVNDFATAGYSSVVSISGKTVTVNIASNVAAATYNLVLKAYHAASDQTAYQYIKFVVNSSMNVTSSGVVSSIIKGASETIQFSSNGGIGTVTWESVSMPAGLSLNTSTGKVTGTPTTVGKNTVTVKANSSSGESKQISVEFTVYSKIVGGNDQTILSVNSSEAKSTAITNATDIKVTWAVTSGTLPSGATLDANTGVITFKSSVYVDTTVTLTGTAGAGPTQTATKKVTLHSEPTFTLSTPNDVLTFINNTASKTTTATSNAVSKVTFSVTGGSGVTFTSSGNAGAAQSATVTVKSPTTAGMNQTVTVKATTAFGQSNEVTFTEKVEAKLAVSLPAAMNGSTAKNATATVTVSGGSGNSVNATSDNTNVTVSYANGTITASAASHQTATVTVTVTSAAGQTASATVPVEIFSAMSFTSSPTNGAITFAE